MRVVREPEDVLGDGQRNDPDVLATEVEVAESTLSQARGLMFRSKLPEDFALVMDVGDSSLLGLRDRPPRQFVHMLFMRLPIDVLWLVDDEVVKTATLSPWLGFGVARADRIIELPARAARKVRVGDTVRVEGYEDN